MKRDRKPKELTIDDLIKMMKAIDEMPMPKFYEPETKKEESHENI